MDTTIEAAAYFVVCEALTNVTRYADASAATVDVESTRGTLFVTIADDGVGGADPEGGSGLRGLFDRVHAIGGRLQVSSPPGKGTRLRAELPTKGARVARRRLTTAGRTCPPGRMPLLGHPSRNRPRRAERVRPLLCMQSDSEALAGARVRVRPLRQCDGREQ